MQFSTSQLATLVAFLPALVSAHMQMIEPASVFVLEGIPNAPLDPSGSNYPCMITSNSGGAAPEYPQGSNQKITLRGSAIHGGGSCQVSITYDNPPTKNSQFKVIKSFQGACPPGSVTGNLVSSADPVLPFTIPSDLPAGNAVVAWTWFNRIGNREMYMRCAPVKITGSAGSKAAFNALPEIFKANINNIGSTCKTTENTDVIFPNPGKNVVGTGSAPPTGCGPVVQPPVVDIPVPTKPILIVNPTTTAAPAPPPPATTTVAKDQPAATTTVVNKAPTSTKPAPEPTYTPKPDDNVPKPSPPKGDACVDGEIVCTTANTFSMCNFGELVPMGVVAAGTECSQGKIVMAKRSVRFSHDHMRRRHNTML